MKILFIINPVSGNKSNDKVILHIHQRAIEEGFDFKFLYTTGSNDDAVVREQLAAYKPDRVIVGGGDGTLQMVARNMLYSPIEFGILPLGSANGFSTSLGISSNLMEAVDQMINSRKTKPLDLLKFNGEHICIHLGDIGINARMVKEYHESEGRGMISYAKHLLSSMQESPLLQFTITTPDETVQKQGYMLAFANANKYGTGVHISEGSVSDGKFEICNVERIAFEDALKAGLTIFNVFIDKEMFADVISCAKAEITISEKIHFQIDGEYMGTTDRLSIEVIPSAIKLLIPD